MYETGTVSRARNLAWLSLVFSVVALLFAISAYGVSRTGATAPPADDGKTSVATSTVQSVRAEAYQELEAARSNLRGGDNYEAAAVQLNQAESRLREAYQNVDEDSGKEEWRRLQVSFDNVEAAMRARSADALRLLENLIADLANDVEVDQKPNEAGE